MEYVVRHVTQKTTKIQNSENRNEQVQKCLLAHYMYINLLFIILLNLWFNQKTKNTKFEEHYVSSNHSNRMKKKRTVTNTKLITLTVLTRKESS